MEPTTAPCKISGETSGAGVGGHAADVEFVRGADCREVLPQLPAGIFDACVTDPPYGLGMAAWDKDVPGPDVWAEVLRVLKPGSVLAAFCARRTHHRLARAVETAGFIVVDMVVWVYRTGRPPSRNHLRPAHEPILIARAPGKPMPVNIEAGRIPWRDAEDQEQARRIDPLRATGKRRAVYQQSLDAHGRDPFQPKEAGRWPSTVMAVEEVLDEGGHVFVVPKVKNRDGHICGKPVQLITHLVNLFVPIGGVVLDPFAGSGPTAMAAVETGRRAVLIDAALSA